MGNRRRTTKKRRPASKISPLRKLNRTLGFEPLPARVPADPPNVKSSFTYNITLPFRCVTGDTSALLPGPYINTAVFPLSTGENKDRPISAKGNDLKIGFLQFSTAELYACFVKFCRMDSHPALSELAVKKICLWGISAPAVSAVTIGIKIDQPSPWSSRNVIDTGSTTSRAKCGLTCPYNAWINCADATLSTFKFITVEMDAYANLSMLLAAANYSTLAVGQSIGDMHVTVSVRVTPIA